MGCGASGARRRREDLALTVEPGSAQPLARGSRQGTLPDEEIAELLGAVMAGEIWTAALERLQLPTLSRKRQWFVNERKADFYRSLAPTHRDCALDVGPGSGVIAAELARDYAHVIALELDPRWCRFVDRRFAQDRVQRAFAARGDALALPCADASVDLVVLNGVLEWVPEAASHLGPRAAQLACLCEIRRTLRPGGVLGIAIENRWYLENFLGFSPHGEPPFAAVLPRRLADWQMQRRLHRPYRTWIYGARGYRRLLAAAGFCDCRVYGAMPTYHEPREAVPLSGGESLRRYFVTGRPAKAAVFNLLERLGLLGQVVHSFYISARRPGEMGCR